MSSPQGAAEEPQQKRPHPFAPPRIQSPDTGDTVGLAFTAAGTYDAALGPSGVEGQLYAAGTTTTVGSVMPGTLPGRGVWKVPVTAPSAGSYDLKVTLLGVAQPATATVRDVKAEQTPALVLTAPPPAVPSGTSVSVVVSLAQGHHFQSLTAELQNALVPDGQDCVVDPAVAGQRQRRYTLTGRASDEPYVVVVTGDDGAGNLVRTRAGAILLT